MESKQIYEESRDELCKISKELSANHVDIDFSKLDAKTREALVTAIQNVISNRLRDIDAVVLGVQ